MSPWINIKPETIEANIQAFTFGGSKNKGLQPNERYASFDYCFNYFQNMKDSGKVRDLASAENLETSCLHLGFYLASWGMLRGSSSLLQKSARFLETLIQYLAQAPVELWEIDAHCYSSENIQMLLECKRQIGRALTPCGATDTLASKIMLGVFGNVPAFDQNFKYGFGVSTFGKLALEKIQEFYFEHQTVIERNRPYTIDFVTGKPTHRRYTRAKVIDIIFFIQGS
jgi:hypothetical protein